MLWYISHKCWTTNDIFFALVFLQLKPLGGWLCTYVSALRIVCKPFITDTAPRSSVYCASVCGSHKSSFSQHPHSSFCLGDGSTTVSVSTQAHYGARRALNDWERYIRMDIFTYTCVRVFVCGFGSANRQIDMGARYACVLFCVGRICPFVWEPGIFLFEWVMAGICGVRMYYIYATLKLSQ